MSRNHARIDTKKNDISSINAEVLTEEGSKLHKDPVTGRHSRYYSHSRLKFIRIFIFSQVEKMMKRRKSFKRGYTLTEFLMNLGLTIDAFGGN